MNQHRSPFFCLRFWKYAGLSAVAAAFLFTAWALPFGDTQWNRAIYMFQWRAYPGVRPVLAENYTGRWTDYHADATKAWEGVLVNGKLDGKVTAWHANGRKCAEAHFLNGHRHGTETWWDEDGNVSVQTSHFYCRSVHDEESYLTLADEE